jgi:hypothetical protein
MNCMFQHEYTKEELIDNIKVIIESKAGDKFIFTETEKTKMNIRLSLAYELPEVLKTLYREFADIKIKRVYDEME